MIDESTSFGARAARHLREEVVVWLTTVTPSGSPLPRPVWFRWDGEESAMVYSRRGARIRNIESNPRVTLNFDGDGQGGDIVVFTGEATIPDDAPPADQDDQYVSKYDRHIARLGLTPETFAQRYELPVRIRLARLDGH